MYLESIDDQGTNDSFRALPIPEMKLAGDKRLLRVQTDKEAPHTTAAQSSGQRSPYRCLLLQHVLNVSVVRELCPKPFDQHRPRKAVLIFVDGTTARRGRAVGRLVRFLENVHGKIDESWFSR